MRKTCLILMTASLLIMTCFPAARLHAASFESDGIEGLSDKYKLDRSDTHELLRLCRGAVSVGVGQKRLENLVGNALAADLEFGFIERALVLVTNTALNGLPITPVLNKFSEGLAKGVDGDELIEAMENRALSLKRARQLLSVLVYEGRPLGELETALVTVAGALERDVSEVDIEEVFREEGTELKKLILKIENLR